jgi:hypothetical protein
MKVQGPGSNEIDQSYWLMRAINWTPWPLDEGPRPKSGKSRLNLHGTILEAKSIGWDQKNRAQRRAHDLENQGASQGLGVR